MRCSPEGAFLAHFRLTTNETITLYRTPHQSAALTASPQGEALNGAIPTAKQQFIDPEKNRAGLGNGEFRPGAFEIGGGGSPLNNNLPLQDLMKGDHDERGLA